MKNLSVIIAALALGGCTPAQLYPVTGDRAGGTVTVGHDVGPGIDSSRVDWSSGLPMAIEKCKKWGYETAESFGGVRTHCNAPSAYGGCAHGSRTVEYQCIGHLEK